MRGGSQNILFGRIRPEPAASCGIRGISNLPTFVKFRAASKLTETGRAASRHVDHVTRHKLKMVPACSDSCRPTPCVLKSEIPCSDLETRFSRAARGGSQILTSESRFLLTLAIIIGTARSPSKFSDVPGRPFRGFWAQTGDRRSLNLEDPRDSPQEAREQLSEGT